MNIKQRIERKEDNIKTLKAEYKVLIDSIKTNVYDYNNHVFHGEKKDGKPRADTQRVIAISYFVFEDAPSDGYSNNINVSNPQYFCKDDEKFKDENENIFYIYNSKFKTSRGTSPIVFVKKKNIKQLRSTCKEVWQELVSSKYSESVELSLDEWIKKTSADDIVNLLINNENIHLEVVNEPKLGIKDWVVIYPEKKSYKYYEYNETFH